MATFVGIELDYYLPVQSHASYFVSTDLSGGGKYDSNNVRHVTISLIDKQVMLIDRTKNTPLAIQKERNTQLTELASSASPIHDHKEKVLTAMCFSYGR